MNVISLDVHRIQRELVLMSLNGPRKYPVRRGPDDGPIVRPVVVAQPDPYRPAA